MYRNRHTKIIATLGPVSSSPEMIEKLFLAGADNFRLNFSHGSHEDHQQRYEYIRTLEKKYQRPISIVADLQGPKLRIHTFNKPHITLEEGQFFTLDLDKKEGDESRVCLPHPEIFKALEKETALLLDDGKIRLKVISCDEKSAYTQVMVGGVLSARKGVNVPNVTLPISALTEKDKQDLAFAVKLGADWIALSFVQQPKDVQELRVLVGEEVGIISKIEKPKALEHLEDIISLSDAIMVARGDLGVEMPLETVPGLQKKIIRMCRAQGKPVIVATQMLESMIHIPTPTRAEASDVATAVYEGVDCVMLSAESASGEYPIESVSIMSRIIEQVEQDPFYSSSMTERVKFETSLEFAADKTTALAKAARQICQDLAIKAIVTLTNSGNTALKTAYARPSSLIIALTPHGKIASRLSLVWGVRPFIAPKFENFKEMYSYINTMIQEKRLGNIQDQLIILQGDFVDFSAKDETEVPRLNTLFKSKTTSALQIMTLTTPKE